MHYRFDVTIAPWAHWDEPCPTQAATPNLLFLSSNKLSPGVRESESSARCLDSVAAEDSPKTRGAATTKDRRGSAPDTSNMAKHTPKVTEMSGWGPVSQRRLGAPWKLDSCSNRSARKRTRNVDVSLHLELSLPVCIVLLHEDLHCRININHLHGRRFYLIPIIYPAFIRVIREKARLCSFSSMFQTAD